MTKQTISNFLKQLRKTSGLSASDVVNELQEYNIDISAKTLYGYESGLSMLNADAFVALCKIYKCDNPMNIFGTPSVSSKEFDLIEKYRSLDSRGEDIVNTVLNREAERMAELEIESTPAPDIYNYPYLGKIACAGTGFYFDDIPTDTIEAPYVEGADFIIGVSGESMEPDYHDGEKLYVRKVEYLRNGDVGIFTVGNECFLKELGENGLISRNRDYDDIPGDEKVRLVGKVIGKVDES